MKEAIGNTFVFNVIIVFVAIISLLLVSSLAYSKAFKVKNRIIDIIEQNRGYTNDTKDQIDKALRDMGYPIKKRGYTCPAKNGQDIAKSDYKYCVYVNKTEKGYYYTVTSFIVFEFPVIGQMLTFPVAGETRIIYDILECRPGDDQPECQTE